MRYLIFLLLISCAPTGHNYLKEDNDYFTPYKSDHDYTQGLQIGSEIPDDTGSHEYYGKQTIYTPTSKKLENPPESERPYAGYLSGGYRANYLRSPNIQDTIGIEAGLIGPHSLGEQTQSQFHRLIGDEVPNGWGHQLHDEPTAMVVLERKYLYDTGFGSAILPVIGGDMGTPFTQGYAGTTFRVGYHVPYDFQSGDPIFPRLARQDFSVWAFAGGLERIVAYNVFLDGNTFRDSRSVDKETFVTEGRIGIAGQYKGYRIMYSLIAQTKEYETESHGMRFGEVTLGWGW